MNHHISECWSKSFITVAATTTTTTVVVVAIITQLLSSSGHILEKIH